jgi:hypothetical protein
MKNSTLLLHTTTWMKLIIMLSEIGRYKECILRAGGVAQVVKHLPSKCGALNSNPISPERKRKEGRSGTREGGREEGEIER